MRSQAGHGFKSLDPPTVGVSLSFPQGNCQNRLPRMEWGTGENDAEEFFAGGALTKDLDMMEKVMGTASQVQRWREANNEAVGTEGDVVKRMRREIERLLREAGVEEGKEIIRGSPKGVLLVVKKKA